jgi:ATP phosphoribosyltransferase regulatory subunit
MGLRADMTPQVARIDAHLLNREGVARLCYCGTVLHTRPRGLTATREPLQVGAEIYGHAGIESDVEIQQLLRTALASCGVDDVRLDVGHVGVFRAIARRAGVPPELELDLLEALLAKDRPGITALTEPLDAPARAALRTLPELYGGPEVLDAAAQRLPAHLEITAALADLRALVQANGIAMSIDLADLRGYHYHSGVVFAAYSERLPSAIALGGRYDEVGKAFGRARPATGFSMDLREIARVAPREPRPGAILAPYSEDATLRAAVNALRDNGEIVIIELPGHDAARAELGCDRRLVRRGAKWEVEAL